MKLSDLLKNHPELKVAECSDNEEILSFFNSFSMSGNGLKLIYQRGPDFFSFLKFQSEDNFVFLLRDKGAIQGVGTLIIKQGYIHGQRTTVGYLGDLRVKPGRRNAVQWRKFYDDLIRNSPDIEELKNVQYFITAVIDSNKEAQAALINSSRNTFAYHLLANYSMVNIYFRIKKSSSRFQVRTATQEDLHDVSAYWQECEKNKNFGQAEGLKYALSHWKDFSQQRILLAFHGNEIVGMCGLWSPAPHKKIVLKNLPFGLKLFSLLLKLRRNGFPGEGEELRPLYMTHLNFENTDVLNALTNAALSHPLMKNHHMLSLSLFSKEDVKGLNSFVLDCIPMALYQVYSKMNPSLILNATEKTGFEMALV